MCDTCENQRSLVFAEIERDLVGLKITANRCISYVGSMHNQKKLLCKTIKRLKKLIELVDRYEIFSLVFIQFVIVAPFAD